MERFKTRAETTLSADIDDAVTTVPVTSAAALISAGDYRIIIDDEVMKVTGVSSNDLTVVRGASPASHTSGTAVKHILTAEGLQAHYEVDMCQKGLFGDAPTLPTGGMYFSTDCRRVIPAQWGVRPLTPPAGVLDTWYNQQSATITILGGGALSLAAPSYDGVIGYGYATAGTKTYTLGFNTVAAADTSRALAGIFWQRSATSKAVHVGMGYVTAKTHLFEVNYNASLTAGTGTNRYSLTSLYGLGHYWVRTTYNDGTDALTFEMSINGFDWLLMYSTDGTTQMGGAPDTVGIALSRIGTDPEMAMTAFHWGVA